MEKELSGKVVGVENCARDKMEVIAINKNENMRIAKFGDTFHLQTQVSKLFSCSLWHDSKMTKQEWMASKWILDHGLKVSSDYPTIDEIREMQRAEKK